MKAAMFTGHTGSPPESHDLMSGGKLHDVITETAVKRKARLTAV